MLPPPLPRTDSDLSFAFMAEHRDGRRVASRLTISPPTALRDGQDFYCTVTVSGFADTARNAYGAFKLQALEISTRIARTILAGYEPAWTFSFDDQGPVNFTALNDAMLGTTDV